MFRPVPSNPPIPISLRAGQMPALTFDGAALWLKVCLSTLASFSRGGQDSLSEFKS
jgi:hypothetical protein